MRNPLRRKRGAPTAQPLSHALQQSFAASGATLLEQLAQVPEQAGFLALHRYAERLVALRDQPPSPVWERAVQQAWEQTSRDPHAQPLGAALHLLLSSTQPMVAQLRGMLIAEYFFRSQPDRGRLLDVYRHEVRQQHLELPAWAALEPALRHFWQVALRQALSEQRELRWLLLDRREQALIEQLGSPNTGDNGDDHAAAQTTRLLHALTHLPTQAIAASEGSTITHASIQQTFVLGANGAPPAPDLAWLYHHYQSFILETFGALDFRGILQMKNVVRLRLEDVYIPLYARRMVRVGSSLPGPTPPRKSRRWRIPGEEDVHAPAPLHQFIRDHAMLVVLGDPGSGKSTLVRALLLALASGRGHAEFGLHDAWLPIFFPVAAFADARSRNGGHSLAPLDYLASYYTGLSQPDYAPLFLRALHAGRALVLFDGLDEVRGDRLGLVRCLEALIREWDAPGNRFIATSRVAGYDDAPLDPALFTCVALQELDDDAIRLFISRWSSAFERAGTQHRLSDALIAELELQRRVDMRTRDLTAAVFTNANVTTLARNPLLLTILALIHHQGASLPDRRVDLYQVCVQALAETWHRARSLSGREVDLYLGNEKLDERFVVNLLGPAALWMQEHRPGGLVERDELEQTLAQTLIQTDGLPPGRARRTAQSFVDLMHYETGLLQERGYRRYGFMHLTFEEYLAARALLESVVVENPDAIIHHRCVDPRWREVLRLTVAAASQREAQHLILHMLAAPTTPATAGRPVVLAGECLLDIGRNSATQQAWLAVREQLVILLADVLIPLATRLAGGLVLGQLGDPRLLDIRTGTSATGAYWCPVPTLPACNIARLPVTNAEFALFMAAQGYQQQAWWTANGWQFVRDRAHAEPLVQPSHWNHAAFAAPNQPVVGVSWYEAAAYCAWLTDQGRRAGWLAPTATLRLPTSAEWHAAATHGEGRPYVWGDAPPTPEHANYDATAVHAPTAVGCFPQGQAACGALDLAGNVWEWTCTLHHPARHASPELSPQHDFAPDQQPIIRGGAFNWSHEYLHNQQHYWFSAAQRRNLVGFRLVRVDRADPPTDSHN